MEPPRPSHPTNPPNVETFAEPSKPRPYYARPPPASNNPLPLVKKRWPFILAFAALGITGWAGFLLFATNQEKLSSSIFHQIMRTVRDNPALKELLGDSIRPESTWILNGDPWINGMINTPQGSIDLSFCLKGHKGKGTLYFTSLRKAKGEPFRIIRFKVIGEDGSIVHLPTTMS